MAAHAEAVRTLLRGQRHGVLATLSTRHPGWPFASLTPYALSEEDEPLLLLSALAEHTRNVQADSRASLFVYDVSQADPQAGGRVTLLGRVHARDEAHVKDRYLARHPTAEDYFAMSDFGLYVLRVEHARYVGGFGEMGWLDSSALRG
jgi:putative heme iron utilization protein